MSLLGSEIVEGFRGGGGGGGGGRRNGGGGGGRRGGGRGAAGTGGKFRGSRTVTRSRRMPQAGNRYSRWGGGGGCRGGRCGGGGGGCRGGGCGGTRYYDQPFDQYSYPAFFSDAPFMGYAFADYYPYEFGIGPGIPPPFYPDPYADAVLADRAWTGAPEWGILGGGGRDAIVINEPLPITQQPQTPTADAAVQIAGIQAQTEINNRIINTVGLIAVFGIGLYIILKK